MKLESTLPTSRTSAFSNNQPLLYDSPAVLRVVRDFRIERPMSAFSSDIRHIAYDLQRSNLLKELIDGRISAEISRDRPESADEIIRLKQLRSVMDEPSPYANVRMRFERHSIGVEEYEPTKANFLKEMKMILKKGETNIIFLETGAVVNNFDKTFLKGFNKYHSALKAYAYGKLLANNRTQPNDAQVFMEALTFPDYIKRKTAADGSNRNKATLYHTTILETIDELLKEGYKVRLVFENFERFNGDEDVATKVIKDDTKRMLSKVPERNIKIVQDMLDLVRDADMAKSKINIFLVMGSLHVAIEKLLPNNLRPITDISIDPESLENVALMEAEIEILKAFNLV